VVLLGEIDDSRPAPPGFTQADPVDVVQAQRAEKEERKKERGTRSGLNEVLLLVFMSEDIIDIIDI
jgi:hypothetical protein